jgi:hypothetical protein
MGVASFGIRAHHFALSPSAGAPLHLISARTLFHYTMRLTQIKRICLLVDARDVDAVLLVDKRPDLVTGLREASAVIRAACVVSVHEAAE